MKNFIITCCIILQIYFVGCFEITQIPGNNQSAANTNSSQEQRTLKIPKKRLTFYYDYTTDIDSMFSGEMNRKNADGEDIFERFRARKAESPFIQHSVFYSTDTLMTEMKWLSSLTDLLSEQIKRNSTLLLSYRFVKNGKLDSRRFQDALQGIAQNATLDNDSLRQQISGIILDWTDYDSYSCDEMREHANIEYMRQMNISFTKYAQRIAGTLLGTSNTSARVKVGIAYSERQIHCGFLRPQILDADFIVVGLRFNIHAKFPMTYTALTRYMDRVTERNDEYLYDDVRSDEKNSTSVKTHNVTYMVTLKNDGRICNLGLDRFIQEHFDACISIDEKVKSKFFPMLRDFIWAWAVTRGNTNQIIFQSFNYTIPTITASSKSMSGHQSRSIPYLNIYETDVSSCALKEMIQQMSWYPDVVFNEYTWSAIVNHETGMNDPSKCKLMARPKYHSPERVHLFVSSGIWTVWSQINETLSNLIEHRSTAAGMSLETVVFSAKDIRRTSSDPVNGENVSGISQFMETVKENYNISIGCLVDFGRIGQYPRMMQTLNVTTHEVCAPVMNSSSVVVWQFEMNLDHYDSASFSFELSLKYHLLEIIVARKMFMEQNTGKDVMIQLSPTQDFLNGVNEMIFCMRFYDLYDAIEQWGRIYGVRFILRPMLDTKHPMFGIRELPSKNGKSKSNLNGICGRYLKDGYPLKANVM